MARRDFAVIQPCVDTCDDQRARICHIPRYPAKFIRVTDEFIRAVDHSYRVDP